MMKMNITPYLYSICILLTTTLPLFSHYRTWTDVEGRTVEARFLCSNHDDSISFVLGNGQESKIPLDVLSQKDIDFINDLNIQTYSKRGAISSPDFEIRRIRQVSLSGYTSTSEGLEYNIQGLEVQVRYNGPANGVMGYVKVYFYDQQGREVARYDEIPNIEEHSRIPTRGPRVAFDKGKRYEFHFPISRVIDQRNWKSALVVFGDNQQASAQLSPSTQSIAVFSFPEKKLVFPGWNEVLTSHFGKGEVPSKRSTSEKPIIEISNIERTRYGRSVWFNNRWEKGAECLVAEIRSTAGIPRNPLKVQAYFIDRNKQIIGHRRLPSTANVGNSVYIEVPTIAVTDTWYPVVFALDMELERLSWRWALVYVEVDEETQVGVLGPSVNVQDFYLHPRNAMLLPRLKTTSVD